MNDTKAYCTLYKKSFSVAALGIMALHIHAKVSKHLSRLPPPTQLSLNFHCVKNVQEKQRSATEEKIQSTVSSFMINEAVIDAEIMWVIDVVMSNDCLNSSYNKKDLFKEMFKYSKIAQSFTCGSTKCSCMINFGLAPYFQELLPLILTEASFYVPYFDESHNSTLKKGQMDLHVRYLDNYSNIVQTRY